MCEEWFPVSQTVMKRLISIFLALAVGISLFAQGKVTTKKYRLADFTDKVTKVVLSGNELLSDAIREEVVAQWTASAYEFCTLEQFEKLKTDPNYYFLIAAESRFPGEETPGITFLTLVKGDPAAAEGISAMPEIISLPLVAAAGGSGRELLFAGALVRAVQEFTLEAMESEKVAYSMESWFNRNYNKYGRMMQILIPEEDLAPSVSERDLEKCLDEDFRIVSTQEADSLYLAGSYNTLVSYVVAPFIPSDGSYCYRMLFDAGSNDLFYIERHKITPKRGVGILPEDLRRLARRR